MFGFLRFRQTTTLRDGSDNVIVQIQGSHNQVVTGAASPHLALTRFEAHRQARTELERLSPYARSVPLLGREEELAELRAFCAPAAQAVAVRVLVGAGGGGKTRLALSLCETLAAEDWATGFATGRELERFAQQQNVSAWGWRGPTLVVVDDAASNTHGLAIWIEQLAQRARTDGPPLRVLLLEREARVEDGWWPKVFAPGGWDESGRQALLQPREPWPLRSLPGSAQTALVRHVQQWGVNGPAAPAVAAQRPAHGWWRWFWGRWRQRKPQATPPPSPEMTEQDAALQAHLRSWGVDEPLFLMMSALQGGAALSRAALALRVARREADRLNAVAQAEGLDAGLLRHWVACITLAQGLDEATLSPLIEAEKAALALPSAGDAGQWLRVLRQVLPPTPAEALAPMGPDWIGQAFLLVAWPPNEAVGAQTVRRCRGRLGARVLPVLVACVQNFAAETPGVMPWLQALVDEAQAGTLADLLALDDVLPSGSGILANVALDVAWAMHAKLEPEQVAAPEQADVLRRLALALSNVGKRDEALNYARQAESLFRELAQHNPLAFRPVWASSLGTLANMLSEVGQRDEALGCARQAESLHRELAQHNPQAFLPVWATSLNNLAIMLSGVGQRDEALGCARQAESLRRELAQHNPQAFRPVWATSLHNLAIDLAHAGERAAALATAEKALNLYEQLAKQWPDVFAEDVKTTQQLYQALGGLVIQLPRPAPQPTATPPVRYSAASFPTLTTLPSPTPRWTSGVITMLDLAAITALASTAVTLLTPLLEKIAEGGAQELGTSAIKELVDKFKRRFSQPQTQEALDDLAQQPTDADAQAVLRQALKKAMRTDPGLATALEQWIKDVQPQATTPPSIQQTIHASGDHNKNVQIAGSGNSVS